MLLPLVPARAQSGPNPLAVDAYLTVTKKDVEKKIAMDPKLKALAGKYPLVLLNSREWFCWGDYLESAFSFIYETNDPAKHKNDVQLVFDTGGERGEFDVNMVVGQSNLVADLGDVDFTANPNPQAVDINGDGQNTWLPGECKAVVGHVYLERVYDKEGNKFFVMFKVVAVESEFRYVAFLWRKLPGGKIVRPKDAP
jgi:hypothetical protein